MRQDFDAVGRAGVQLLINTLESGQQPSAERVLIEPRLIVRSSTTPN